MTKKLERTPIESLGMELQNIQQSIAGIYRIGEFLKEKEEGTFTRQIGYFIVKNLLTNFITKPDFIAYHYKYKDCLPLKICRRFYKIPIYGWTFRDKKAYKENEPYFEGFIFEKFVL